MVTIRQLDEDDDVNYGDIADKLASEAESESEEDEESSSDELEEHEKALDDHQSEENSEESSSEDEEQEDVELPAIRSVINSAEPCTFDIRNLVAMNSHGVNESQLYSSKKKSENDRVTIAADTLDVTVQEDYLLEKATDGCNQLLSVLWQVPVERSDAGPLGTLPKYDELSLPRSLPPPPPKQLTKWEKFAKEKGLPLNKNKRSRKVWDEATGEWKYRHGYEKANDDTKEWPIMEVKGNQDPFEDPWERARDEKKARRERNMESRMKNMERTGSLPKGTAKSVATQRSAARAIGKAGGNKDRDNVLPIGVPVDLKPAKDSASSSGTKLRGKESTVAALLATQRSTASLGRFDKLREGEPERKKALTSMKKRKFESATDKKVLQTETERSMKLLKSVVEGGGVAKEKARKKGQLAKGETGYDYDFDDGLGASSFRKKKGRAGVGKAKKMTKKRIK